MHCTGIHHVLTFVSSCPLLQFCATSQETSLEEIRRRTPCKNTDLNFWSLTAEERVDGNREG